MQAFVVKHGKEKARLAIRKRKRATSRTFQFLEWYVDIDAADILIESNYPFPIFEIKRASIP
ncbi:hypothetical protein BRE01_55200 [Brevibacillus reuszeri]|uniref:Uncharacterized protein n=1 Tax=Brevibacillus reuszeri TaxID=54915 RepID=A0ABQ0TV79_9BACL|nr:hypothetical protein BRE01_55200 [Brevibacillus reuszeri]